MKTRLFLLVLLSLLSVEHCSSAQVKSPQDFLGFRVGDDYKLADGADHDVFQTELDKASIACAWTSSGSDYAEEALPPRHDHITRESGETRSAMEEITDGWPIPVAYPPKSRAANREGQVGDCHHLLRSRY